MTIFPNNTKSMFIEHDEQKKQARQRRLPYLMRDVRKPEFSGEAEGDWRILDDTLKTKVKLAKDKPLHEQFEDEVWLLFHRMGFDYLNSEKDFVLEYGKSKGQTKQLDVVAADDECAFVVECKRSSKLNEFEKANFKNDIEAYAGYKEGIRDKVKKLLGNKNLKVAFVFATRGYIVSEADRSRLAAAGIQHFAESELEYYRELADHLGQAARYQLEADLFSGQKIPTLKNRVNAIEGKMGGRKYYTFSIEPDKLLKLAYILHRSKSIRLLPTYQRLIKRARLRSVNNFIESGGFFPNSLIVSIDSAKPRFESVPSNSDQSDTRLGVLHLPQKFKSAYIIDGQHRLYAFSGSEKAQTETIPVVAFFDMPRSEQLQIFMEINENQKAVSKNLRLTLDADIKWSSDSLRERMDSVKKRLALDLGEDPSSPLYGRVQVGEDTTTELRFIKLNSIVTPLNQGPLIGDFTKSEVKRDGHFFLVDNEKTLERARKGLFDFFDLVSEIFGHEWSRPSGADGILLTNKGIHALIKLYGDLLDHLSNSHGMNIKTVTIEDIRNSISPYLVTLKSYVAALELSDRNTIRDERGQTAPSHLWRRFQKAIRDSYPNFDPDGLTEFLELQSRKYNQQSYDQLTEIERTLNERIGELLENHHGSQWQQLGIPEPVFDSAWQEKGRKERENAIRGTNEPVDLWHDCMYLINYKEIMRHGSNWSKIFQKTFTVPGHGNINKEKSLSWLQELNGVRRKVMHPNSQKIQAVTQEEAELVSAVYSWLVEDDGQAISGWYDDQLKEE